MTKRAVPSEIGVKTRVNSRKSIVIRIFSA